MPARSTPTLSAISSSPHSDPSQPITSPPAADHRPIGMQSDHQTDLWSAILSGKKSDLPPVYIHPMEKRSAAALSDKSLEICTESLGSETGSDGYSAAEPTSPHPEVPDVNFGFGSDRVVKKSGYLYKRSALPPPLPSESLRMRSRRQNGRLVMEAVSVPAPAKRCFKAERHNCRLLLTFADRSPSDQQRDVSREEVVKPDFDDMADEVARVSSASGGFLSRPYVHKYGRYNCKMGTLLLKEPLCIVTS